MHELSIAVGVCVKHGIIAAPAVGVHAVCSAVWG